MEENYLFVFTRPKPLIVINTVFWQNRRRPGSDHKSPLGSQYSTYYTVRASISDMMGQIFRVMFFVIYKRFDSQISLNYLLYNEWELFLFRAIVTSKITTTEYLRPRFNPNRLS